MSKEMPTRINPAEFEQEIYNEWLEKNYFHADENSDKEPFSIVIPPPNVTGSLHIGHALNNTLIDVLCRYHRMAGKEVLWMPGTDHAGIATQNVVEKQLKEEGLTRHDLGREKFIERVWKWREESGGTILNQLKRLGASCDWDRERFTMDEGLSKAVRKVFVTLYKDDLIYRDEYMVNWCPRCHTALSDLEVEHEDLQGGLYNMQYPVKDSDEKVTVATTRPETMLGDTAVAVHPEDDRYKHLIGKTVILPLVNREIPVIGDEYVDMELGTGCLKVTPAHDPNDFLLGKKHQLAEIDIMDENGCINSHGGKFEGMDRFAARKAIIEAMDELGLFVKKDEHMHSVGHCQRCSSVVEPKISMQWFVKIKPLAEKAIKGVETEDIKIIPETWKKTYYNWMYEIRDWCISRQIWWGHQIPAWHCEKCGHTTVSMEDAEKCEKCGSTDITQETDVLDTWFSSGLWPFSTMGWPEETKTLEKFYPTSVLVTGFDILFFWVARMIMSGYWFMEEKPFKDVYLHALVRDQHGQKMSKSKGNVIDPLTMVDEYGADAFRFTLAAFAAQGRDVKMSEDRIEGYRNFVNKIWNASRFIMMNLDKKYEIKNFDDLAIEDKWILQNLKETADKVAKNIESYDFNEAAGAIYQFFWHKFCDWYIEFIKNRVYKDVKKDEALATASYVLEQSLVILHPFMPFLSEYIYKILTDKETIMFGPYPKADYSFEDEKNQIDHLTELIGMVRNIRGEYGIAPSATVNAFIKTESEELTELFKGLEKTIMDMGRIESLSYTDSNIENSASNIAKDFEIFIPLEGLVDFKAEVAKLEKEKKGLEKDFKVYGDKLKNEGYLKNAPAEVIEKDKQKFADVQEKLEKVNDSIERYKKLC